MQCDSQSRESSNGGVPPSLLQLAQVAPLHPSPKGDLLLGKAVGCTNATDIPAHEGYEVHPGR